MKNVYQTPAELLLKYPCGRAALYWILILGVYFHVLLENLFESRRRILSYLSISSISCISCFVAISFFHTMNLRYTKIWKYDSDTRSMLEVLNKNIESGKRYRLGVNWLFEPTINYYRKAKDYVWLEPVTRERVGNKEYDYYYTFVDEKIPIKCKEEIQTFSTSNAKLVKNCSDL